jgi:hypothetical protein
LGGDANISVQTGNVISAAIGDGNTSEVNVGTVKGTEIGGDVGINVTAGNIISAAIGSDNTSKVSIGSIE